MKDFELRPPGGVAVQMWKDGSLHFKVGAQQISMLQLTLKEFEQQLSRWAIQLLETEKQTELTRQVLPMSRIQQLESELNKLKADEAKSKTFVSEGYEPNDGSLPVPGV